MRASRARGTAKAPSILRAASPSSTPRRMLSKWQGLRASTPQSLQKRALYSIRWTVRSFPPRSIWSPSTSPPPVRPLTLPCRRPTPSPCSTLHRASSPISSRSASRTTARKRTPSISTIRTESIFLKPMKTLTASTCPTAFPSTKRTAGRTFSPPTRATPASGGSSATRSSAISPPRTAA